MDSRLYSFQLPTIFIAIPSTVNPVLFEYISFIGIPTFLKSYAKILKITAKSTDVFHNSLFI